jgi:hypothetical protein
MESLEKQAGLSKQASDDSKEDLKHEKQEDKTEGDAKAAIKDAEKDFSSLKKMNEKEESKDKKDSKDDESKEQTKEAQAAGAELADVLLQKVASVKIKTKEMNMNKQASVAGKALADALLTKLANVGDTNQFNGIPAGVAPNKNQLDNANLVAEQDSYIKPMPTKDAIGNGGGTINQIFDGIVADALGQGASTFDVSMGQGVADNEGAVEDSAVPHQVQAESAEKTAAVISLVNSGVDFDSAVDMVKAAAFEIEYEEDQQVKQAAFDQLIDQGVDFELAAALVKSANAFTAATKPVGRMIDGQFVANAGRINGAKGTVRSGIQRGADAVSEAYESAKGAVGQRAHNASVNAKGLVNPDPAFQRNGQSANHVRLMHAKNLARNPLVYGGAGALAAGGAGAYALGREKKAAVSALMDAGVDFEQAVSLVQAKADEIYGS